MSDQDSKITRRNLLLASAGTGVGLAGLSALVAAGSLRPPEPLRATDGDRLVFAEGEREGEVITTDDLTLGGPMVFAYPAADGKIKSEGPVQIIVMRFEESELSEETRQYAAGGVVAYSAVCTHLGCPVSIWMAEEQHLQCPCHFGVYDPKNMAKVLSGPPPRSLPILPLRSEGSELVVAGELTESKMASESGPKRRG
jgi:rieske iron-sulfur protein